MGLDLFCGDHGGIKMGSYSMVHEIRLHWIKAFIKYLNSINEICPPLNNSIQKGDIDYREFEKIKCNQQNDRLVQIFQSLKEGKYLTNYNLRTNRKMLKLKDSAKKKGGNTTHLRKRIYRNKTMKLYS